MHAEKSHTKGNDFTQRFLHPVSLQFGAAYRCPCDVDCMARCRLRGKPEDIRNRRAQTFSFGNSTGERLRHLRTWMSGFVP